MRIYLCNSYSMFLGVEVLCCICTCIALVIDITFNDVNFSGLRFSVWERTADFFAIDFAVVCWCGFLFPICASDRLCHLIVALPEPSI